MDAALASLTFRDGIEAGILLALAWSHFQRRDMGRRVGTVEQNLRELLALAGSGSLEKKLRELLTLTKRDPDPDSDPGRRR